MANGKYTELDGRLLYYDGDIVVEPDKVENMFYHGIIPKVTIVNNDIDIFNRYSDDQLEIKKEVKELHFNWKIPEEYLKIDVYSYIQDKLNNELMENNETDTLIGEIKRKRVEVEFLEYKKRDLLDLIKTLIYIINKFNEKSVVWGVGRGSSVSSYILYLIGVHDIDSVKYDLDLTDFFRD